MKKTVYLVLFVGENNPTIFNINQIEKDNFKNLLFQKLLKFINQQLQEKPLFVIDDLKNLKKITSCHKHFFPEILIQLEIDESDLESSISEKDLYPKLLNAATTENLIILQGTVIPANAIKSLRALSLEEYQNTRTSVFSNSFEKFSSFWSCYTKGSLEKESWITLNP